MTMNDTSLPARLPGRALLDLTGPEARALLQRVITTDVEGQPDTEARTGALLTPQGKIIVDFLVFVRGDTVWLDVPESEADALLKRLTLYRLKADVTLSRRDDLVSVWSHKSFKGAVDDPRLNGVYRGITEISEAGETADLTPVELEQGVPVFGRDYAGSAVFPTDVNLDAYSGIGWTKGCFIGQEVVSRMKRRGTIRKRTLAVTCEDQAPTAGTPLTADGVAVGEITASSGSSATALIRLDKLDKVDAPLVAGDCRVTVHRRAELEPDDAAPKIQ
ncbi:YgfZ/GcvT domain-containing protein [Maricaulis sp. D1M11]|uniref:CAF17-like 4Fe-4S cluster assembly/insertion protein YgfZ n=1 Tax=Maricaulis sp. D1M11 TaxID=3076117 RepID=UPI0039B3CFB9